jgi:hypothetical protein
MKKTSKVIYKCKPKYKRIKYFKLPLIINEDIKTNDNLKYNIDTINIHSSKIISKQNLFMGLMLFSGVLYFIF